MGALCNKVVGMLPEIFLPGLFYQVRVLAECFWAALLEHPIPRWNPSLFGAGGLFWGCLGCGYAQRHTVHRVWRRILPFGPRGLLGHWHRRNCWSRLFLCWGGSLGQGEWVKHGCMPPKKFGRKPPVHLWALPGWCVRQPGRQKGSQWGICLPLRWLAPPGVTWLCCVVCRVTWPGRPSRSWHL